MLHEPCCLVLSRTPTRTTNSPPWRSVLLNEIRPLIVLSLTQGPAARGCRLTRESTTGLIAFFDSHEP